MSDSHIVIIGDLVQSRQLEDRAGAQETLQSTLEECNNRFTADIQAPFVVTLGDEFQGLVSLDFPLEQLWWAYQTRMRSVTATRFAFGIGQLATKLSRSVVQMDGPCFHATRDALRWAKSNKRHLAFGIDGAAPIAAALTHAAPGILDLTMQNWTSVQWETVCLLIMHQRQIAVAEARGVTKQSVQDVLKSCRAEEVIAGLEGLSFLFRQRGISGYSA